MTFVDEAVIEVVAGHGGAGAVGFRRESKVPLGGPDGGDGGRGGDVVIVADARCMTLLDHRYKRWYKAQAGAKGGNSRKTGRGGVATRIPVPPGTLVLDEATGEVLADLVDADSEVVVARGGRGGQGNARFATSTRQSPRFAQEGQPGESKTLRLSLRLVADIGLVGLPNAGKSTFIRSVTNSQAKVGAYPFTTLVPNLGIYRRGETDVVLADIPGLIQGAHEGHGLGDQFLKHLERTRVLIHLISLGPDATDPLEAWEIVCGELRQRSVDLAERPQLVVLNKIDLVDDRYELSLWAEEFAKRGVRVMGASGLTRENIDRVMTAAMELLSEGVEHDEEPEAWSPV